MKNKTMIVLAIALSCVLALLIGTIVTMSHKFKPEEEQKQPAIETESIEEQTQSEKPTQAQKPTDAINSTKPEESTKPTELPKEAESTTESETEPSKPLIETPVETTPDAKEETKDSFRVDFDALLGGAN